MTIEELKKAAKNNKRVSVSANWLLNVILGFNEFSIQCLIDSAENAIENKDKIEITGPFVYYVQ